MLLTFLCCFVNVYLFLFPVCLNLLFLLVFLSFVTSPFFTKFAKPYSCCLVPFLIVVWYLQPSALKLHPFHTLVFLYLFLTYPMYSQIKHINEKIMNICGLIALIYTYHLWWWASENQRSPNTLDSMQASGYFNISPRDGIRGHWSWHDSFLLVIYDIIQDLPIELFFSTMFLPIGNTL